MSKFQRDVLIAMLAADIALNVWSLFNSRKHNRAWSRAMADEFSRIQDMSADDLAEAMSDGTSTVSN